MAGKRDAGGGRGERSRTEQLRLAALFHPRRQGILQLLFDGREVAADEIAAALGAEPGHTRYHLRILVKRGVLQGVARGAAPPLYRWSPRAGWARKMLRKDGE